MKDLRMILLLTMERYLITNQNPYYNEWLEDIYYINDFDEIADDEYLFNHAVFVFNSIINRK